MKQSKKRTANSLTNKQRPVSRIKLSVLKNMTDLRMKFCLRETITWIDSTKWVLEE